MQQQLFLKQIEIIAKIEIEAVSIYKLNDDISSEMYLHMINTNGINRWNEILVKIERLQKLDLNKPIFRYLKMFKKYIHLRLQFTQLDKKRVSEKTTKYGDEMAKLNEKIIVELNKLNNYEMVAEN